MLPNSAETFVEHVPLKRTEFEIYKKNNYTNNHYFR